jgi:type IV pilus assembly protein PilW
LRQLEGARFSLDSLAEDVMHAGYFSDFNPDNLPNAPNYQTPDPCAVAPTAQGWDTSVTPIRMPVPIQGIAAGTVVACLSNRLADTEAVVVRHADTGAAITMATARTDNLYFQVSRCGLDVQPVLAAAAPAANPGNTFTLRRPGCAAGALNDSLRRLIQRTYYVASCNDCAANDGIPTLKRVEMINGALRTTSIAEGVENLQVEYGLDTTDDGQPDAFGTIGSGLISGVTPAVWENVVAVRLHLLTRNTQASAGYADTRTYRLGPDVTVAPTDGFKRTLMTSTVRLHNVGGRRE